MRATLPYEPAHAEHARDLVPVAPLLGLVLLLTATGCASHEQLLQQASARTVGCPAEAVVLHPRAARRDAPAHVDRGVSGSLVDVRQRAAPTGVSDRRAPGERTAPRPRRRLTPSRMPAPAPARRRASPAPAPAASQRPACPPRRLEDRAPRRRQPVPALDLWERTDGPRSSALLCTPGGMASRCRRTSSRSTPAAMARSRASGRARCAPPGNRARGSGR